MIDAHQHFWNLETGSNPWMAGDAMRPLRRDFGPDDLLPLMAEAGIDATILVQCRHDQEETRDFLAMAKDHAFVAGVVGWVDLQANDCLRQIGKLRALPGGERLVGIRHNVHDEPDADWLRRPAVSAGVSAVFEAGLTFDLLVRSREVPAAIDLVRQFPSGRFVLDHMAKPPIASGVITSWRSGLKRLAAHGNVWCKISGLVTEAEWGSWRAEDFDPYMRLALDAFGPERIMFGSDWPVCTLAGGYKDVRDIAGRLGDANPELADRFFHLNAIDAYRLR
ncbi:amidohydrolase family protein [Mesorhizobium sp. AR07]|uniref:amidohydrolase family protein n=1 Tax=Mesorhizobium sp. AR07 TaxID=2865838 RepID=UPI0029E80741|nr:amidohydrolase family protein [Mesorhizobium sp. AR07]